MINKKNKQSLPVPSSPQTLATTSLLPVSILDISYTWDYTIRGNLLCLLALTERRVSTSTRESATAIFPSARK